MQPAVGRVCIMMACTDLSEADEVGRQLLEVNRGCLVTYRRAEDLLLNVPAGRVALVILATDDSPAAIAGVLRWLRNRWPRCQVTVVGDTGGDEYEMTARQGGAYYLTRPVASTEWAALLSHVLGERPEEQQVDQPLREGQARRASP